MKAGVTGHTKGIGRSFYHQLESRGYQVVGFSRSNGFDISDPTTQDKILDECDDCDIFINNAHSGFAQAEIFSRAWARWRDTNKTIVSVSSISVYSRNSASGPQHPLGHSHYAAEKAGLDHAHHWAWCDHEAQANAVLIRPGLTETPRTQWSIANTSKNKQPMDPDRLAKYLLDCIIECPYHLKEITVWHRRTNA